MCTFLECLYEAVKFGTAELARYDLGSPMLLKDGTLAGSDGRKVYTSHPTGAPIKELMKKVPSLTGKQKGIKLFWLPGEGREPNKPTKKSAIKFTDYGFDALKVRWYCTNFKGGSLKGIDVGKETKRLSNMKEAAPPFWKVQVYQEFPKTLYPLETPFKRELSFVAITHQGLVQGLLLEGESPHQSYIMQEVVVAPHLTTPISEWRLFDLKEVWPRKAKFLKEVCLSLDGKCLYFREGKSKVVFVGVKSR